jgi:hypothetical protein
LDHLGLNNISDAQISDEVRLFLVSADFSTELTTSVLWLNKRGLDITCIRLQPYKVDGKVLIDITQTIPLREAEDYLVKLRAKEQKGALVRTERGEILLRFWSQMIERSKKETQLLANRRPTSDHWLTAGIGRAGFHLGLVLIEDRARVECVIRLGGDARKNKTVFQQLYLQKGMIENAFGGPLEWEELPERLSSRIQVTLLEGGWRSPEEAWPQLQENMLSKLVALDRALRQVIQRLNISE